MLNYTFIQNAYITGTIIAVVSGFMGIFIMAKNLTFLTHILSEIGFAGASFALFMNWSPLFGMLVFTLISSISIGKMSSGGRKNESLITAVSSIAIGSGVAFLALSKKNSSSAQSILFGSIFTIDQNNVIQILILSLIVFIVGILMYRKFRHFSFDYVTASYSLKYISLIEIVFLIMIATTVSVSSQIVGSLLIFILMTLPASSAMRIGKTVPKMILWAIVFAISGVWIAIALSYMTDLPTSFYIAIVESGIYFASMRWK